MLLGYYKASPSAVPLQQSNWHPFHRAILCNIGPRPGKSLFFMFQENLQLYQTALQIKCLQEVIFVCQQAGILTL